MNITYDLISDNSLQDDAAMGKVNLQYRTSVSIFPMLQYWAVKCRSL